MALGVLNNLSAIYAENNLNNTNSSLQTVLQQLSSGSKINSGADDAAGLSLVNGLGANSSALTQSKTNATEGAGLLQVADGAGVAHFVDIEGHGSSSYRIFEWKYLLSVIASLRLLQAKQSQTRISAQLSLHRDNNPNACHSESPSARNPSMITWSLRRLPIIPT